MDVVGQAVTVTLPRSVYDQLRERAHRGGRRIEDEAALVLASTPREAGQAPIGLDAAVAAPGTVDDAALWRVSQSQPTVEDGVLLDALVDKGRRAGVSEAEALLLADLVARHDRVMVLRAEAVALLHARGHDVSGLVARA